MIHSPICLIRLKLLEDVLRGDTGSNIIIFCRIKHILYTTMLYRCLLDYMIFVVRVITSATISGPRFTKIRKSYEIVRTIVQHRLNEFVEQKSFVQTFVKRAPGLFLPILGKSNFFFSWEFSCKLSEVVKVSG